jgi:hypothetical protein
MGLCCLVLSTPLVANERADTQTSRMHVRAAIDVMGGEDRLRSIQTDELKGIGHHAAAETDNCRRHVR